MYSSYQAALCLLEGIAPVDYHLARQVGLALGCEDDALLMHSVMAVSYALRQGHSCLHLQELAGRPLWHAAEPAKPGYSFPPLSQWCEALERLQCGAAAGHPLVFDLDRLYLRRYWAFEVELAERLAGWQKLASPLAVERAREVLDLLFTDNATQGVDQQRQAVANCLGRRFSIIVGGPGTGKTYTVTRLLAAQQLLAEQPLKMAMAAPTGKAAQRLRESVLQAKAALTACPGVSAELLATLPEQASTLHRLLGVIPGQNEFRHNRQHPLELDLLLVDEASMIDLPLMTRLVRALPEQAILVMLGDADQLPSVAAGSVLADLTSLPHPGYTAPARQRLAALTGVEPAAGEGADHLAVLSHSHRFSHGGEIATLAGAVIDGEAEQGWRLLSGGDRVRLATATGFDSWLEQQVEQHFRPLFESTTIEQAFSVLAGYRLLAANRVGPRGTEQINLQIEQQLRRSGRIAGHAAHYPGRPVMVTENHYELGLFNGDVGLIWPHPQGRLQAVFEESQGSMRWVGLGRLPAVETVFAMTIHKTQGSEFDHVALVLPEHEATLLSRELLYTAITRARERLTVYSGEPIWRYAVNRAIERFSGLAKRLFG